MKTYSQLVSQMANDMDIIGELPSMYCDEFKQAVCHKLLEEKKNLKSTGHLAFNALTESSKKDGKLIDLIIQYANYDEEDESKSSIAIKIAETIMKSSLLYYRSDIEDDVELKYSREYGNNSSYKEEAQSQHYFL